MSSSPSPAMPPKRRRPTGPAPEMYWDRGGAGAMKAEPCRLPDAGLANAASGGIPGAPTAVLHGAADHVVLLFATSSAGAIDTPVRVAASTPPMPGSSSRRCRSAASSLCSGLFVTRARAGSYRFRRRCRAAPLAGRRRWQMLLRHALDRDHARRRRDHRLLVRCQLRRDRGGIALLLLSVTRSRGSSP